MKRKKSHKDLAIQMINKREYARKYYQAHKARARAYYLSNSLRIKERAMVWRVANRERYLEQQREYDRTVRLYRTVEKRLKEVVNEGKKRELNREYGKYAADRIKAFKWP